LHAKSPTFFIFIPLPIIPLTSLWLMLPWQAESLRSGKRMRRVFHHLVVTSRLGDFDKIPDFKG
jgi:hypothetical protein